MAGNVMPYVAPGTEVAVLSRIRAHLRPDGFLVVGLLLIALKLGVGRWLKARGIIAIAGVDTRALTARIREKGMPNGVIAYDWKIKDR